MPKGAYPHKRRDPKARFFEKLTFPFSGCWEWCGSKLQCGYGEFWNGDRKMLAHRWSYEQFVGPIPADLELDHLCRNRGCVSPYHLEPVTRSENALRGLTGHHRRREAEHITHCPQGHEYDEVNTWLRPNRSGGLSRHCRACERARVAKWQRENKDRVNQQQRRRYAENRKRRQGDSGC